MSVSPRKCIIWTSGLDDFISGRGIVGGLTVQMYFWSRLFVSHGWLVESFTAHRSNSGHTIRDIYFTWLPAPKIAAPLIEILKIVAVAAKRPDMIIVRGASRTLFVLGLFCRLFAVRLVMMFASDSDLLPGRELVPGKFNRKLFELGIKFCRCFICQNEHQLALLKKNYPHCRDAAVAMIPNIWIGSGGPSGGGRRNILWIGNFRELKHPELFIGLAQKFPSEHFVMAGGFQQECYKKSELAARDVSNLDFLGPVAFEHSQRLFREAKLFVCTSDIEGFPNTFLQAFCNGIPVLTTFDPSDIVASNRLGIVVPPRSPHELAAALDGILQDAEKYHRLAENAAAYFAQHYAAEKSWRILLDTAGIIS